MTLQFQEDRFEEFLRKLLPLGQLEMSTGPRSASSASSSIAFSPYFDLRVSIRNHSTALVGWSPCLCLPVARADLKVRLYPGFNRSLNVGRHLALPLDADLFH